MTHNYGTKYDRLYVALVLPFKMGSFEVDENALRKLIRYYLQPKFVDAGGGIIINPEAGELLYLTRKEKRRIVEIAMEEIDRKVPLFAGVGGLTTKEAIEVATDANELGVDGLFLVPPVGSLDVTTSWDAEKYPEIWIDMVRDIVKVVDLPVITHPAASPDPIYGLGLPKSAMLKMIEEIPNIVGWKMIYRYDGYKIIARALQDLDRHVAILPSTAKNYHEVLATEMMDGALTGSFCYAMEAMLDHIAAWKQGNLEDARKIWNDGLAILHEYVYSDYTRLHIRYKIATWLRGLIPHPLMRPPLPRPKKEEIYELKRLLKKTGLSVIEDVEIEEFLVEL